MKPPVITKTTLKTLVGGGGVLVTWFAVTPTPQQPLAVTTPQRSGAARGVSGEDLSALADRLRARIDAVAVQPSRRNPFRFAPTRPSARAGSTARLPQERPEPAAAPVVLLPNLSLSGVAEKKTADGVRRTAVISGDGQLYLVSEGESVAGRFTVVTIDAEVVILRDADGSELRLALP
jgi:hypothetical protein